jgi:prepilin-type N-terminal cleavage/methylation domain-containing protein
MRTRGFTIVEIIVTITIMGILLTLAVVGVGATQQKARDDERIADVEAFASHLESFYRTGKDTNSRLNRYPSTDLIDSGVSSITTNLRDIDLKSVMAPGVTDPLTTLKIAPTNSLTQTPTKDEYIYQPLQGDGTLCTGSSQDCRKYYIYYFLEGDSTVHVYSSKNQ